jgi:hypothetical protein
MTADRAIRTTRLFNIRIVRSPAPAASARATGRAAGLPYASNRIPCASGSSPLKLTVLVARRM